MILYDWVGLFGVKLLQLNVLVLTYYSLMYLVHCHLSLSIQIVVTSHEHNENKTKGSRFLYP